MKRFFALAAVLAVVGSLGCAAGERRAEQPGLLMGPEPANDLGYTINWATSISVPRDRDLSSVVVLGDMIVAVERPGNRITGISMRNGEVRWRQVVGDLDEPLLTPFRVGDSIYISTTTRLYTLATASGELQNVVDLANVASTRPVLIGSLAVFGGVNGRITAYDVRNGFPRWSYQLPVQISSPPVEAGPNVFGADSNGNYVALTTETGDFVWRGRAFGAVTAPAAVDEHSIYVPSHDESLYALDQQTGRDRWIFRAGEPLTVPPKVLGEQVYLPVPGEGLVVINAETGRVAWRLNEPAVALKLTAENRVLLTSRDGLLLADTQSGDVLERGQTQRLVTVLEGPENSLILVSPGGRLLRLNPRQ